MNKEKINAGIDRMAEEAKETMNLLSDKIDRATRCGNEKAARIKRSAKAGLRRTTDAVQETVDRTAERIRDNCPNKPAHTKPHGRTLRGCGRLHETSGQTARRTPPASRTDCAGSCRRNRFAGDTRCRTKKFCNIEIFTIPLHSFRATD